MLRQFDRLEISIMEWKASGIGSDTTISANLESEIDHLNEVTNTQNGPEEFGIESVEIPAIDLAITDNYLSAIFEFLFALETGNEKYLYGAIDRIQNSLTICGELNLLPQWWVLRITKHLLQDLWDSSFHKVIPLTPDQIHGADWSSLRWLFIASLFKRSKSEIDLWPSQLEGARRAVNDTDDLVVSLPTSAGKTRIAELCILRCLAIGKRVLFITPLRALSAQTESSLRKTFLPLGKSVSSLYGSIGTSDFEQDVLKTKDIVVGTPEKLDFALRNDPTLIDDVGLIVLDEGHMIGLNEREINYEVQIQRLLKRVDANQRRIVCLSAILPDGDQFEDFVDWIRQDKEGGAIQSDWRPTDLRFGEIVWQGISGRVNFTIGEEQPFIPRFISSSIPPLPNPGLRTTPFPKDAQELTLAAAWKLTEDNHTVLIYCPQRSSVDAFSKSIINLHKRGALRSILSVPEEKLELARVLGVEWLGCDHPIVACLNIGVAVHHGALPTPFRKEMEKLLREGVLKVTVSSPTLAQGLNLAATAVVVHSLYRSGELIDVSEFKNVVGRAGRAFVDTHGLVLHPIFDRHDWRKWQWRSMVSNANARNMESGLLRLVASLLQRMANSLQTTSISEVLEYVMNNTSVWDFPGAGTETERQSDEQRSAWSKYLVSMDTAILSLLGDEQVSLIEIPEVLDSILQSSLWHRRLNRKSDDMKSIFNSVLAQRAKYIWSATTTLQRKGYFLAGVGLETGQRLDAVSQQANALLVNANFYISDNNQQLAITTITDLAELIFNIPPFSPRVLPDDWKRILEAWLKGETLTQNEFIDIDDAHKFIEDGMIYRLPWGMEAVRVRAQANEDVIADQAYIDDYELDLVVPAVENGTLNRSAALLMQAGFNSRQAAIYAVDSTSASFTTGRDFKSWLSSELVHQHTLSLIWPTPETSSLWWTFLEEYKPSSGTTWKTITNQSNVIWNSNYCPQAGDAVKIWNEEEGNTGVIAPDGERIGVLTNRYNLLKNGVYSSIVSGNRNYLDITYCGTGASPFEYDTK